MMPIHTGAPIELLIPREPCRSAQEEHNTDIAARLAAKGAGLAERGNFTGAIAAFTRSLEANSNVAAVHEQLAQCLAEEGQCTQALAAAHHATDLAPQVFRS